ncbi:MAG: protein translocase subunit SecD [Actinomycetes bacterium]
MALLIAFVYGAIFFVAPDKLGDDELTLKEKYSPRLGLDLEGGTSVILTPRVAPGAAGKIEKDNLDQAVQIIRSRVDSFGVAEAEVTTAGDSIVISVPGSRDSNILDTVRQTAELRFRPVLAATAGTPTELPSPSPSPTGSASPAPTGESPSPTATTNQRAVPQALKAASTPAPTAPAPTAPADPNAPVDPSAGITPEMQKQFLDLDCQKESALRERLRTPGADDPKKPLVTCSDDQGEKYILGPAEVLGTDVSSAAASLQTNQQGVTTGGWIVTLDFTGEGTRKFADTTRRLAAQQDPLNRFGIVLDGLVVSAPGLNDGPITGGNAQIEGDFTQQEARDLANVLKYGALPLTFDPGDVQEVSPTLGGNQLHAGLVAGIIGLALVVLYSLLYYRGLGLVTVASLAVATVLTYGMIVLLGWQIGFRLSLAGIAGTIVAIGITADSFVVFFERLRDEVRDGKTLRVAVETGWVRARRTILAADFVSFLGAVILYLLSVGSVRGFAFTLGLTTVIDVVVVFLFTKPLVALLARTKFYGQGHRLSGLDPRHLGVREMPAARPTTRRRPATAAAAKES